MAAKEGLLDGLDEKSQRELAAFLEEEQRRAAFQTRVHSFTEVCFEKCIKSVKSKPDKADELCVSNCVERFLDLGIKVLERLQESRQK